MVTHNGDSLGDALRQSLEEMYLAVAPPYVNDVLCSLKACRNVACWRLVWMEGACLHMPKYICHIGRLIIEEGMEKLDRIACNVCTEPIVPATILPLYSKGPSPRT